ncbi:hypothetical protein QTI51_09485 [Variovorax sp. J22G73]|uniref:hypothetical protein n=1 Tax=unclassified Variovorax TaxID=663243 RepID=UPI0025786325|nr:MULTISPECIES: hypothetical protein [unclassified Variovorax]MDM0006468.1 hypothetical protein [Variovorax sp. J22R203]MDM0097508.1 hypothetical protein [Variovorax sp. J22G73]
MIKFLITAISKAEAVLETLANRETLKAQAKLVKASALVAEAGTHRAAANTGRRVASALRDLVAPAPTDVA